jgi:hypothetical protein
VQAAPDKDGAQGRGRVSAEVEQQLVPMWLGQGPGAVRAGEGPGGRLYGWAPSGRRDGGDLPAAWRLIT